MAAQHGLLMPPPGLLAARPAASRASGLTLRISLL
jgi:hypothetical protein